MLLSACCPTCNSGYPELDFSIQSATTSMRKRLILLILAFGTAALPVTGNCQQTAPAAGVNVPPANGSATTQPPAPAPVPAANAPGTTTPAQRENYDPLLDLPPLPRASATLIGGTVSYLDEISNKMEIMPFGTKRKMKVAFDTRTHFYQDSKPISYKEIRQGQRIYLDTMLNGSTVFAKTIWIQSTADSGIGRGQIMSYEPDKNLLTIRDELSSQPLKMKLTQATVIRKDNQTLSTADLAEGALVSLTFGPQREVREVTLLAKPGSTFTFAGRVTYLDMSRKLIAVDNRADRLKYDISIDAIAPNVIRQVHEGSDVSVSAVFDGSRYDARRIDITGANSNQQP